MALVAALALVSGASTSGGGPNWQTPADLGATPMPKPIVRVSAACGFSCALGRVAKAGRGGTVLVPRGVWVSPPVNLTSHLTVYLAAGAVVKADTNVFRDGKWPLIQPLPTYGRGHPDYNSSVNKNFWGARWAPFINGYNLTHVTIGGENGTIDGSGAYWWARHFAGLEKYTRPPLFSCLRCNDVLLEDTTFKDSAFWTIHPVLGRRLAECTVLVNQAERRTIHEIFGSPDDLKFRSCMTLFARAAPAEPKLQATHTNIDRQPYSGTPQPPI